MGGEIKSGILKRGEKKKSKVKKKDKGGKKGKKGEKMEKGGIRKKREKNWVKAATKNS